MSEQLSPIPKTITLHKLSRILELEFDSGERFLLPCAYLRACSTSAEMRLLSADDKEMLLKNHVNILAIEPVGQYAIKLIFSDGHQTGIYSFSALYDLGLNLQKTSHGTEDKEEN